MSELFHQYERVNPTTWVYLSSLLIIGLYFKFNRFWSVRNLDIILLILFAPGLVLVHLGQQEQLVSDSESSNVSVTTEDTNNSSPAERASTDISRDVPSDVDQQQASSDRKAHAEDLRWQGFIWLMVIGGLFLIRLLLDPAMIRRPQLESNLSLGGLTFLGLALFAFLVVNVLIAGRPLNDESTVVADKGTEDEAVAEVALRLEKGPGYSLLERVPSVPIIPWRADDLLQNPVDYRLSRLLVILSHLTIVLSMVAIGYWHFESFKMGIGAATLYLILPYTAQMGGRVDHAFPAAMLIGAIVFYRRPLIAGAILGLAACIYYPLFLLPLWISYYSPRGLVRFLIGVISSLTVLVLLLYWNAQSPDVFITDVRRMFGLFPPRKDVQGIWMLGWEPYFRLPVMTAFFALSATLALWPAQKNLGTLMSCSAAILVATRFWNGNGGGLYMGWYLPLILVTVFRPNLEDRVALKVIAPGWSLNRRTFANSG